MTDLERQHGGRLRNAVLCGAGGGVPLHPEIGTPAGEMFPLLLLLGLFVSATVWMFRRFGSSPAGDAAPEAGDAREGRTPREPLPAGA